MESKKNSFLILFILFLLPSLYFMAKKTSFYNYHEKQCTPTSTAKEKYKPQSTPEASYKLELELLGKGEYCYDLPMFDPEWRKRGKKVLKRKIYMKTAKQFDRKFKVYIKGKHAIIYYPDYKNLGPTFLYKKDSKWILDRTCVIKNIHYNIGSTAWFAYDGYYPYLALLHKIFDLKSVTLKQGNIKAFMIR